MKERDLVAGTEEYAESCNIIHQRCKKVITVFSPSFSESNENIFLAELAQFVGTQHEISCKIIPIILNPEMKCDIPPQLELVSKLPYICRNITINFWDRLIVQTLEVPGPLRAELREYKSYIIGSDQIQTGN